MKILFLLALLVNIIFFLWESNSEDSKATADAIDVNAPKQILLKSELPKDKEVTDLARTGNKAEEKVKTLPVKPSIKELVEAKSNKIDKEIKIPKDSTLVEVLNNKKDSVNVKNVPEDQTVDKDQQIIIVKDDEKLKDNQVPINPPIEKPKQKQIKQVKAPNNKATLNAAHCYQVGPFESADAFGVWSQLNKIDPSSLSLFNKEIKKLRHYMVYYPAAENIDESNKNVEKIQDSGITDLWLFTAGEDEGLISLGLYDREPPALLFIERLAKLDINAEIKPIYNTESVIYSRISTMNKDFKDTITLSDKQQVVDCESQL